MVCFDPDGSFHLIGEAFDAGGRVIGYSVMSDVTDPGGATIVMPAWRVAAFNPIVTTGGLSPDAVELSILLSDDGIDYLERGAAVDPRDDNTFYSPGPFGGDVFDRMTHVELARWDGAPYEAITSRRVSGPLLTSLTVDLASVLLPRLTDVATSFDGEGRLNVLWVAAGPVAAADGELVHLVWADGEVHQWIVLVPPATSAVAPPPPPGGSPFADWWPDAADDPLVYQLRLDDADFAAGYRGYLARIGDILSPPARDHTLRTTELRRAP